MILNRPDPSVAVRALKSAAPYIRMYKNKKIVVVMPAYNAAKTLEKRT